MPTLTSRPTAPNAPGPRSRLALAALMVAAGILHFVIPATYERIVPRVLGHARALVLVSGWVEILAGLLLAVPRTRRLGAWLTVALLVVVFPANVQMALDSGVPGSSGPFVPAMAAWLRLPLQTPLVVWALRLTRPDGG